MSLNMMCSYPVSGPKSSPLQSTHAQSPSIKDIGSPQIGQSGGGPLSMRGRIGSSISSSSIYKPLGVSRFHLELQRFFGTLSARDPDKSQTTVDDRRRDGTHRMAIRKFLAVRGRDVDFTIRKAILHAQLFPQAFC